MKYRVEDHVKAGDVRGMPCAANEWTIDADAAPPNCPQCGKVGVWKDYGMAGRLRQVDGELKWLTEEEWEEHERHALRAQLKEQQG